MRWLAFGWAVLLCALAHSGWSGALILDEGAYWRRYYRFGADPVSPAALRAEGEKTLGKNQVARLKRDTERSFGQTGLDHFAVHRLSPLVLRAARKVGTEQALRGPRPSPAGADWAEHVFLPLFFDPYAAPPPPDEWTGVSFDDSSWVLRRGPFQVDLPNDVPPERTTGNMTKVHIEVLQYFGRGMQACCYRTRFLLADPAAAGGLTLRLTYRGGARVAINGEEVARGHLPAGALAPDTPGEDYPVEAYRNASLRDRTIGPVPVPSRLLRKGVNVLAVEIRASLLHPIVLSKPQSKSWNALHDREGLWRHAHLSKLELRSASAGIASALQRPAGVQVWVQDIHHRVQSAEFPAPGEGPGTVRIVGGRNGAYSAQIVVGTDRELARLRVTPGELRSADGAHRLPASVVEVLSMAPYPADGFSEKLGDERGLGGTFPDAGLLARYERMAGPGAPCIFDHITPALPPRVPAGTCWPIWLRFRIPPDAAPGTYRGSIEVAPQGAAPVKVPVEAEVSDWRVPDPGKFQTFVACEQNPYGVAKHYGVPLWSDEHFRLLDASFRQLGRLGNTWLNVPVLRRTEFGNKDDSLIRWIRGKDGALRFDYALLDRYLDLAVKHWGVPRVVQFVVMHASTAGLQPPTAPEVTVLDEATGKTIALAVSGPGIQPEEKRALWHRFATALCEHMKARGLDKSMHWGYPHDKEEDPELRVLLAEAAPAVYWSGGPHQIGTWGYKDPRQYRVFGTVRYFNNWPTFRMDMGWKSPVVHLTIPRIDSSVLSLHTASHPFAFRVLTDHSLALGRSGFCRVGADEWALAHYDGMRIPTWIVGMPVLFTLWPGKAGAESSARFEALLEGIQEGEARIFLEQAVDRGRLPQNVAQRARDTLARHFRETGFFQNKLCVHALEQYHYRWQERSRALYRAAAEVATLLDRK